MNTPTPDKTPDRADAPAYHMRPKGCGCWTWLLGGAFAIMAVFTLGYFSTIHHFEKRAFKSLSPAEKVEFAQWLQEPADVPPEMLAIKPAKPLEVRKQEFSVEGSINTARSEIEKIPGDRFQPGTTTTVNAPRATSIIIAAEGAMAELRALVAMPQYMRNNRTAVGCGYPSIWCDHFLAVYDPYVTSQLDLGNHSSATEALEIGARFLRHDPEYKLEPWLVTQVADIWELAYHTTTDTEFLRRQLDCIRASSATLADSYSDWSFIDVDHLRVGHLMKAHGYRTKAPVTRFDYLEAALDRNHFYRWLYRRLPTDNPLAITIESHRWHLEGYQSRSRIDGIIDRFDVGFLKPLCRRLMGAVDLEYRVSLFKKHRGIAEATEAATLKRYDDLGTSLTIRIAEAGAQAASLQADPAVPTGEK